MSFETRVCRQQWFSVNKKSICFKIKGQMGEKKNNVFHDIYFFTCQA